MRDMPCVGNTIHTYYIGIYRAYIGISHRGTLVGVHPTISWTVSRYNSREYVMRPTFVSIAHFQDSGRHDFCALEDELEAYIPYGK